MNIDICAVAKICFGQEVEGYDTINKFLANPASSFAEEDVSIMSMACKAVTLLDRAHTLGLSWTAGLTCRFVRLSVPLT